MRRFWENMRYGSIDIRLALYGGAKQFLLILVIGLLIKHFIVDSFVMSGTQMEPAVRQGDRMLVFKSPYTIPLIKRMMPRPGKPVIATLADRSATTVLRVAAGSGDTVTIEKGQFYRNGVPSEKFFKDTEAHGIIPAEYSPNDFMNALRVPAPGDSIEFGTLDLHDLIFAYSVYRQETGSARLKAYVTIGDTAISDNYLIENFALYSGTVDSIPEEMHADWFFWDRLQGYLDMMSEDKNTRLMFTVKKGGKDVTGFRVKNKYLFLLGDNWNGAMDSRHFGPLARSNVRGRPFMLLWGFETDGEGMRKLKGGRIGRFVK